MGASQRRTRHVATAGTRAAGAGDARSKPAEDGRWRSRPGRCVEQPVLAVGGAAGVVLGAAEAGRRWPWRAEAGEGRVG
jgi:hypothetical protein